MKILKEALARPISYFPHSFCLPTYLLKILFRRVSYKHFSFFLFWMIFNTIQRVRVSTYFLERLRKKNKAMARTMLATIMPPPTLAVVASV